MPLHKQGHFLFKILTVKNGPSSMFLRRLSITFLYRQIKIFICVPNIFEGKFSQKGTGVF